MGALVQKQDCHGCACPKTRLSWVLVQNKIVMGALVQNKIVMGALVQNQDCHIEIEFVVFAINCTCGFYHH
jgi:hypothetical protein